MAKTKKKKASKKNLTDLGGGFKTKEIQSLKIVPEKIKNSLSQVISDGKKALSFIKNKKNDGGTRKPSVQLDSKEALIKAKPAQGKKNKLVQGMEKKKSPTFPNKNQVTLELNLQGDKVKKNLKLEKKKSQKISKTKVDKLLVEDEKVGQLSQKWSTLFRKSHEDEAKPYNMYDNYEAKSAIIHKTLGWGYILDNKNNRLEVLFKDGVRFLISNYKSVESSTN